MATPQKTQSNVQLLLSDGASPEVYTEVDGLTSINGPDGSTPEIDTTHLNSTAREFLMGIPDNGSIQCSGFYDGDDTQHAALYSAWANGTSKNFNLKFINESPNEKWAFSGYVQNFSIGAETDQAVTLSFSIRISGAITVTGQ